jgi:phage terminase Nu1 subunit (DNA packaging protein)
MHRIEFAKLVGLEDVQMVDHYAKHGHIIKAAQPGFVKTWESLPLLYKHLRSVAAGHASKDGKHDVAAESAQLKATQRRLTELKIAQMEGDLISATEVLEIWSDLVKDVRTVVLSIPARVQGELPHMVASEVELLKKLSRTMLAELKALGDKPPMPAPRDR